MSIQNERVAEQIRELAGKFLSINGNNSSLLTVTHVDLSKDGKHATVFFTVFPDSFEKTALEFAKRKRSELKKYIRDNVSFGRIPLLDLAIDTGEKNRQRIEEISQAEME